MKLHESENVIEKTGDARVERLGSETEIERFDIVGEASEITKVATMAKEVSERTDQSKAADASDATDASDDDPATSKPVILVVHASVGSGHKSAAEAIAKAFDILEKEDGNEGFDGYDVRVLDILDFARVNLDGDSTASMFTGATRPFYDLTWRFTLTGRLLWGGGTGFDRIMFPKFVDYVREANPVAIVATHIVAANCAIGARMILHKEYPVVCVPTDYEVEGFWPHLYTDLFCVADQHMSETLRARKVEDERIRITGIPVSPEFSMVTSKEDARRRVCDKYGLESDRQIALFLAGATLPRPYIHFRKTIDQLLPYMRTFDDMQMVIVAGKDRDYAARMRREVQELGLDNVVVLDYVDEMADLMSAADLIVCKSGGLTVTECLCVETPMILVGRAYGQEKANVTMLTSSGSSFHVTTYRELRDLLQQINRYPQVTKAIQVNASLIKKPNAAMDIAEATIELANRRREVLDPMLRKHFARFYWGHRPAHVR